ncbi:hypothetical protein PTKIN_Ptkin01aG0351600 [Pterospermum kingtungense]
MISESIIVIFVKKHEIRHMKFIIVRILLILNACSIRMTLQKKRIHSQLPQYMDLGFKGVDQIHNNDDIHDLHRLLVRPLIHEYPLKFFNASESFESKYNCKACGLELTGSGYYRGACPTFFCGYHLQVNCAKLADQIQHPLHTQHSLKLYARFIICDECQDFSTGFVYFCEGCDFKLDLKCATRSGTSTSKEYSDRDFELFHFSHKHKLIFCNFRDPTYI